MKTTTRKLLGLRIKELRKAKGLSQDALAEKVGIDPKHLSRIEVGGSYPSFETLSRIADGLRVEPKDLFEFRHRGRIEEVTAEIKGLLEEADEDKLRLVLKIVRAVVR